jgi:uncharacterized phiE125 gp8 family phage protein
MMILKKYAASTIDPVSLNELKKHLVLDSDTLADSTVLYTSIAAGSHPVVTAYTLLGTAVEVLGKQAIVYLQPINNGAAGTVDVKIQESDDNTTWTDWTGGAFTQVTEAIDTAIQEKQYTGSKRYIRVACKTLVAACEFGVAVLVKDAETDDDDLLADILDAAVDHVEDITRRILLTSTWDYSIQDWPDGDRIILPGGNLQSVTSVIWKDTDGTETTLTENTDYLVETNGEQCGAIVLPYMDTWPNGTLYPSNPIPIRFIAGWTAAASIPSKIRTAIKMICGDLWENRESQIVNPTNQPFAENITVKRLLASAKLWDEFA